MNRTTLASRALIATAALTAIGLIAASPASAHTNNMYTVVVASDDAGGGFSTYGKTDGVVAPLSGSALIDMDVAGIEVAGEKGVAVGYNGDPVVLTWDHSTGVDGVPVALFIANPLQELDYVSGLDTLNDGRTVTLVAFIQSSGAEIPSYTNRIAIASVNAGTGEVIPLVDITASLSIEGQIAFDIGSLATDPISGATYVFALDNANVTHFIESEVANNTFGPAIPFEGDGFENGQVQGVDYDADGTLYFNYVDFDQEALQHELSKLAPGSSFMTADRIVISKAPSNFDTFRIASFALTIEHTALAATGSQVPVAAFVLLGTVAVVAGGLTVMVARRRSERGTV